MKIFGKKTHLPQKSNDIITTEQIKKAAKILSQYKNGKLNLEKRIIENEKWWKMQHWDLIRKKNSNEPEPASGWLFNSIATKHSDAMDNYPECSVLPREEQDSECANVLSSILPVILERNDFEKTYSDVWWYKLKTGTGCYGVFWNNTLENGKGDVDIRQIDILNLFWEGGIKDIQKSRNLFNVELVDNDILEMCYPEVIGKLGTNAVDVAQYIHDENVSTEGKSAVVDWYYKVKNGNKTVVHYCKFVDSIVLYASQNDPYYKQNGYYDHGMYPFVFDPLFTEEGTPCGFGFIDIMKDVQLYIDKLNQIIIKNAMQAGRRRFFISDNTGVNEQEFADWSKEFVHVAGNIDDRNLREITVSQLDGGIVNLLNQKIDEIKEISGNRDVSNGGTRPGLTAASAITALQEAGNKLSRDMTKNSYRVFKNINYMVIELIRQFYSDKRTFRITGTQGGMEFVSYDEQFTNFMRDKKPVFDVEVKPSKSSPFSKTVQNELAKELFAAGLFNPERSMEAVICIEMMDFEGKQAVLDKIRANAKTIMNQNDMSNQMSMMAQLIHDAYKNHNHIKGASDIINKAATTDGDNKLSAIRSTIPQGGTI